MKTNRFSKLAALTQGAAVVGVGVAAIAACAGNEPPAQAPSATSAPADINAMPPAPSAPAPSAPTATDSTPATGTTTSAQGTEPTATNDAPKPGMNALPPDAQAAADGGAPFKTPAQLNAITTGADGGAPHKKHPHPAPNALPPK